MLLREMKMILLDLKRHEHVLESNMPEITFIMRNMMLIIFISYIADAFNNIAV